MIPERFQVLSKLTSEEKRKFSTVYKCTDLECSQLVTCKVILKSRIKSEIELKRIQREGNFNFEHKYIPKLIDFIENEDAFVIVRSFIEGVPVNEFTSKFWRRSKRHEFIKNFFLKAAETLNELHSNGIFHCDIKPANFIIKPDGDIALIDFGLIQFKDDKILGKTLFAMGYSPPEIIMNHTELVNHQSDYFSLGICIWELFTGEIPLRHEHPAFMINLQITHPIPDHHRIPKTWKKIILKLTEKHQFGKPPNQLNFDQRNTQLMLGRNKRPSFEEFSKLVSSCQ